MIWLKSKRWYVFDGDWKGVVPSGKPCLQQGRHVETTAVLQGHPDELGLGLFDWKVDGAIHFQAWLFLKMLEGGTESAMQWPISLLTLFRAVVYVLATRARCSWALAHGTAMSVI